ncbi:MAG TPA: hypothetical protein VF771_01475 [Longimicrobiaceae bacterium]
METELAFCPTCRHDVHLAWTAAPTHEGHANIPDAPELICLDVAEGCSGGTCPLTDLARPVMALRLARSGLGHAPTTRMRCGGCGQDVEMEVVDRSTLLCPVCGVVNRWILLELANRGWVAIGRPEAHE